MNTTPDRDQLRQELERLLLAQRQVREQRDRIVRDLSQVTQELARVRALATPLERNASLIHFKG